MIKLLNGLTLIVREKPCTVISDLIILPDTKDVTSKVCVVLKSSKKVKKGNTIPEPCSPGDRILVLQYDRGLELKAWRDLTFEVDSKYLRQDRMQSGVTLDGNTLKIKKGTPLQFLADDVILSVVEDSCNVQD